MTERSLDSLLIASVILKEPIAFHIEQRQSMIPVNHFRREYHITLVLSLTLRVCNHGS